MKKISYIIFPYRNLVFKRKYGIAVRDLQIIEILRLSPSTGNILIVDRPISVYEKLVGRDCEESLYLRHISLDLVGPLKKRSWTEYCYTEVLKKIEMKTKDWNNIVILDFTPIAKIQTEVIRHKFYWYDLIDNFKKHNRFTRRQKELVSEKYDSINKRANLITGVSDKALQNFTAEEKLTIPNGIYPHGEHLPLEKPLYKYGFLGFVTDKFDVDFVRELSKSDPEFSLLVCGEILDKVIKKDLKKIKNVSINDGFTRAETPELMSRFQVGLIPYLKSKSHDGSPLKLYEYIMFGKPVLTSIDYEKTCKYIFNYNKLNISLINSEVNNILRSTGYVDEIKKSLEPKDYLQYNINTVINKILSKI